MIRQGEEPQAFFIVEKGKGSCVTVGEGNEISGKATLLPRDTVGAKALSVRKKAFATVKAEGKLVVLRMLRDDFEELGLPKKLKLASRPAVYNGQRCSSSLGRSMPRPQASLARHTKASSHRFPSSFFHFDFFLPLSSPLFSSSCLSKTPRQNKVVKLGSACKRVGEWRLCLRVRP